MPEQLRRDLMRQVPKDARVITYCDPNGCPLAGRLALALLDDGFLNVNVLEGDWRFVGVETKHLE